MFKNYVGKLIVRIVVFLTVVWMFLDRPDMLLNIDQFRFHSEWRPLVCIWILWMGEMALRLRPQKGLSTGANKQFASFFQPEKPVEVLNAECAANPAAAGKKKQIIGAADAEALRVLTVWMGSNIVLWVLYALKFIDLRYLFLFTAFFYVGDLICIMFWCPFQSFFMRSRCCVTCRIFNWGHFMMYTPFFIIISFFTTTLVVLSLAVLLQWEIAYRRYPERFFAETNRTLRCEGCTDIMCVIKSPIDDKAETHPRHRTENNPAGP